MILFVLKCSGRFSAALLSLALAACGGSEEVVRTVTQETYSSRPCWFNAEGEFTAFLLLTSGEGRAIPYPISGKCLVEPGQRSVGATALRQLGIVELVDEHGALQRAFPNVSMSTSVITDQEADFSNSRLYYFRARVTPVQLPNGIAYAPEHILQLDDANVTFARFLELTAAEREMLWRARRSPS
jgi:hypothetical protein